MIVSGALHRAKYVKMRGLHNTADNHFHIVELEAYVDKLAKDFWKPIKEASRRLAGR